ncbi:MAG TPA: tetratricopeptide repeat protein [Blastocatellia bacterium]
MRTTRALTFVICLFSVAWMAACGGGGGNRRQAMVVPPAAPLSADTDSSEQAIRFLENRVKRDSEDMIAYNKLVVYYLQRMRETGSLTYLDLASKAANASVAVLPPANNTDGLNAKAQVEYASHDFAAARDDSELLLKLKPGEGFPYFTIGDSLQELGDYEGARAAYIRMKTLNSGFGGTGEVTINQRLARQAELHGDTDEATRLLTTALTEALAVTPTPPRETVAWCRWRLGDIAFSIGDYETAERHYRDALTTFPNYFRAVAALGRVRAARGDLEQGISFYQQAVNIVPDPNFVAALGDLYKLTGQDKEAAAQYSLVEQIGHLSTLNGVLYNRQLALFYADHNIKPEDGYQNAVNEYAGRKDIYGADAVAWTALKSGRLPEARQMIQEAMKLGTRDARLFYHAGMIARAAGDNGAARTYLETALKLSPQFDPLQAPIAANTLKELN